MDNITNYLEQIDVDGRLNSELASIVGEEKQAEAERLTGIESKLKYLLSQGYNSTDILIRLGCTVQQAVALVTARKL